MSTFRVGLIGLPHIRDAFEQLGVETVSADTFLETTRTLREAAATGSLPVLVEDQRQTGLAQLLARLAETGTVTVARRERPVLEDSWASIPIASPLADYLRAAGRADEDIDPALEQVMVDEDGAIDGQLPAADTVAVASADPVADDSSAQAEPEAADWLLDTDDPVPTSDGTEPVDAQPVTAPEPSPQDGRSEPSELTDWLSDGTDSPEPLPEPIAEPVVETPGTDDEDEDFDGLYEPAPSPETATNHPADPERTPPPASSEDEPRRARRRIALPTFAPRPEPAEPEPAMSADQSVDEDLFDGVPARDVEPGETDEEVELDVDDALDGLAGPSRATVTRQNTALGLLLVIYAGKGGVGKTTLAMCLAQAAAETGGLSVCLIDANRGQGDLGLYMRVRKSELPSIYDAVTIGDLSSAIIPPEQINTARGGAGDQIAFWFVQAPRPQREGDISLEVAATRPEDYAEIIAEARRRFDLVIVDTQITEALDTSGLIDRAVGPALARGGYALGMVELSTPGVENLLTSMTYLRGLGADPARMMTIANNISPDVRELGKIPQLLGQHSRWKGAISHDQRIYEDMVQRRIPHAVPPMHTVVLDVLETMTGMAEFTAPPDEPGRARKPWWKRWLLR
ncbi:hypothetical protein BH708_02315 [Brachybacterium sp. P6-10-X1]|uniref:nucleotide-binding protein n=1 Tax=Brachybacterium sp. P6-10-X1 TaxID=1903186 RepID=UPI000971B511|nr:AAA family ATPase [Brachybacterium sp. P6-10-X1]APX31742.1 hypothetical protein BH708_02315 [Brachybacterium sp. P6-10-X1]